MVNEPGPPCLEFAGHHVSEAFGSTGALHRLGRQRGTLSGNRLSCPSAMLRALRDGSAVIRRMPTTVQEIERKETLRFGQTHGQHRHPGSQVEANTWSPTLKRAARRRQLQYPALSVPSLTLPMLH